MRIQYRELLRDSNDTIKKNYPVRVKMLNDKIVKLNEKIFDFEWRMREKNALVDR